MKLEKYCKDVENLSFASPNTKIQVSPDWTKYLMTTHPIQFVSTIGRINEKLMTNIAPFATCLDTSYRPPYLTFAAAIKQHAVQDQPQTNSKMNTYSNIRQNGLFVVNIPDKTLLRVLDIVAHPYQRKDLEDKIAKAGLTKVSPFVLSKRYGMYPPLIKECLAHLECEVIDVHRPKGSDHYLITGKVVGASYDEVLGKEIDEIRNNLAGMVFHHFGASSKDPSIRFIVCHAKPQFEKTITFKLEMAKTNN